MRQCLAVSLLITVGLYAQEQESRSIYHARVKNMGVTGRSFRSLPVNCRSRAGQ